MNIKKQYFCNNCGKLGHLFHQCIVVSKYSYIYINIYLYARVFVYINIPLYINQHLSSTYTGASFYPPVSSVKKKFPNH